MSQSSLPLPVEARPQARPRRRAADGARPGSTRRISLTALAVGGAGIAVLLSLAALGLAQPAPAAAGAGALAVLTAALSLARRAAGVAEERAAASPAGLAPGAADGVYALALELAPNPVLLVSGGEPDDMAGRRIAFANAAARELLRIPREGALLVAAMRHPDVLEVIDESLFGGLSRSVEYETGGAPNRLWQVTTRPIPTSDPAARLALVILRDETDAHVHERMRADFLANASHELRTPLASLTGFIETLRGHARDDPEARERFLAIMTRQAERMAQLIDDLLSLSRIELNEHVRPSGVCDLGLAASDVVDALSPQIGRRGVRIDLRLPAPGAAVALGDRDQIVQVLQNLLDNAVKYSPQGGTVALAVASDLTLETASSSPPDGARLGAPDWARMSLLSQTRSAGGRYVLARISDEGPGIRREHLPRLAERFYRVEGQKSGERMGTGLGLAIVKHIVNRHRGGFYVESAPGRGSAFCVYFPAP